MTIATRSLALFVSLALLGPAPAHAAQSPAPTQDAAKPERASEWPKLEASVTSTVKKDVERLRKAHTPEMEEQAEAALFAVGAGAAPELLRAMGAEKDTAARLRVEALLDRVTGAAHTRLLGVEFANKSPHVRTWALKRCAQFPDDGLRALAEQALTRASAALAKKPEDADLIEERYAAALCLTAAGGLGGLEALTSVALDQWGRRGGELRAALNGVRGDEATDKLLPLLASAERKQLVAGLNLLAGCGSKKALNTVRPHLDSNDNSVRVAAINAMRGIVDGAPPLDKLSAFDAIELAKEWKNRGG